MKKNIFKKTLVAFTAALMMAATTIPASAATVTITKNDSAEHTYVAYQIFDADVTIVEGVQTVTNIQWGNGVNSDALLNALKADATIGSNFTSSSTASDVADAMNTVPTEHHELLSQIIKNNANSSNKISESGTDAFNLDNGYYLIFDENVSGNGSYSSYILKVVGENITVNSKSDAPTIDKTVSEDGVYGDVADYGIGDTVPFEITVTLPNNFEDYTNYNLTINDTYSSGLSMVETAEQVEVYVDDVRFYSYGWTDISTTGKITVNFTSANLMQTATNNSVIKIKYNLELNENAVIGGEGNPNTAKLTYSNNPNSDGTGSTADTPEDKVVVYTFGLEVDKVDGDTDAPLSGAVFKIKNASDKYALVENGKITGWDANGTLLTTDGEGKINVVGIDDGTYLIEEITAPAGYNKLENPVSVTITAAYTGTTLTLTSTGNTVNDGTVITEIENNKGSSLPSTGGIGRTIFFVSGGILVAVAGIILIIKKRMNNAD